MQKERKMKKKKYIEYSLSHLYGIYESLIEPSRDTQ